MGFSTLPNSCIPPNSRARVVACCASCKQTHKHEVWRKQTRFGRLQFLCNHCDSSRVDYFEQVVREIVYKAPPKKRAPVVAEAKKIVVTEESASKKLTTSQYRHVIKNHKTQVKESAEVTRAACWKVSIANHARNGKKVRTSQRQQGWRSQSGDNKARWSFG